MLTFVSTIEKAERSRYADDMEIFGLLGNMQQTVNNPAALQYGLKRFHELRPQDLLLRNGEIDRNKPANLVDEIYHYLIVGRGCRQSMERNVARLESRLAYLLSVDSLNRSPTPTPNDNTQPAVISEPERKPALDKISVMKDFNARALR